MLEEAIASVLEQTFANWELCLVDDGSTNPEIIATLECYAAVDPRHPPQPTRDSRRDLDRHQHRARTRHGRVHRAP
jgi:glycosyltransferase involved in cell wall biosynthesis